MSNPRSKDGCYRLIWLSPAQMEAAKRASSVFQDTYALVGGIRRANMTHGIQSLLEKFMLEENEQEPVSERLSEVANAC